MIPVNEPLFIGREKELLAQCVESGWISSEGPFVAEFEKNFSSYIGVPHGVAVCNGTAALEAALYGVGIKEGDEVIMPSFTIISCALAAIRLGVKPVLVDSESETWCMDLNQIESKITSKTRAIMPVHMYGHPVDMDPLVALAKKYDLKIVEDACEVHGAEYKGRKCGSLGDAAAFSFYANKIISTGEGGMVVTTDKKVAERAASYRNLCFKPEKRFLHTEIGYNFRMTNLQAAVGVAQLECIDKFIEIKRHWGKRYGEEFSKLKGVKYQIEKPWAKLVYWMYCLELDTSLGFTALDLATRLQEKGITTRPFFLGMHEQPAFHALGLFKGEKYPVAERIARQGLYLPSGMALTEQQFEMTVNALKEVFQ